MAPLTGVLIKLLVASDQSTVSSPAVQELTLQRGKGERSSNETIEALRFRAKVVPKQRTKGGHRIDIKGMGRVITSKVKRLLIIDANTRGDLGSSSTSKTRE